MLDVNCAGIPQEWLMKWKHLKVDENFHFPRPNPFVGEYTSFLGHPGVILSFFTFLATVFSLKPPDVPATLSPVVVADNKYFKVWYKKDEHFKIPKGDLLWYTSIPILCTPPYLHHHTPTLLPYHTFPYCATPPYTLLWYTTTPLLCYPTIRTPTVLLHHTPTVVHHHTPTVLSAMLNLLHSLVLLAYDEPCHVPISRECCLHRSLHQSLTEEPNRRDI